MVMRKKDGATLTLRDFARTVESLRRDATRRIPLLLACGWLAWLTVLGREQWGAVFLTAWTVLWLMFVALWLRARSLLRRWQADERERYMCGGRRL